LLSLDVHAPCLLNIFDSSIHDVRSLSHALANHASSVAALLQLVASLSHALANHATRNAAQNTPAHTHAKKQAAEEDTPATARTQAFIRHNNCPRDATTRHYLTRHHGSMS
jgi:hypothetical protein